MNVIRVIVDVVPGCCKDCQFCHGDSEKSPTVCTLTMYAIDYAVYISSKWPDWCPLEEYCYACEGFGFVNHASKGVVPCPVCGKESEDEK